MTTLFVSDLHLEADRPDIADQFLRFLETEASNAECLYILGDLFEAWVGDDDPNDHYAWIKQGIRKLTRANVPVFFMHGNRDFMIGDQFAADTGVSILPDPTVVDLYGQPVLLSHGDAYCTDDTEYQAARAMTRNPEWQKMMLQKSLQERLAFAAAARAKSMAHGGTLSDEIADVNPSAILRAMQEHSVQTMLHGHTHRPAIHEFECNDAPATRIVLGDWYEQGSVVRWSDDGPSLEALER